MAAEVVIWSMGVPLQRLFGPTNRAQATSQDSFCSDNTHVEVVVVVVVEIVVDVVDVVLVVVVVVVVDHGSRFSWETRADG